MINQLQLFSVASQITIDILKTTCLISTSSSLFWTSEKQFLNPLNKLQVLFYIHATIKYSCLPTLSVAYVILIKIGYSGSLLSYPSKHLGISLLQLNECKMVKIIYQTYFLNFYESCISLMHIRSLNDPPVLLK